jgi:hypothetical protein
MKEDFISTNKNVMKLLFFLILLLQDIVQSLKMGDYYSWNIFFAVPIFMKKCQKSDFYIYEISSICR